MTLLELSGVRAAFGANLAVDGVDLAVAKGETVGLIGESGSGKSTLGRIALLLLAPDAGRVCFGDEDLTALSARQVRSRRARMQIVFQEPAESLDPQRTVARSVAEPLLAIRPRISRADRDRRVAEAFDQVGLDQSLGERYPGQLSGGQQQRVGIARAIVTRPDLVVLDEPTSSLDLSVRAGIIALLQRLQAELGMAYLFISHDLGTVEYLASRVVVLYQGRVVESGPTAELVAAPRHPYTRALIDARLDIDPRVAPKPLPVRAPVVARAGDAGPASGCPFRTRCPRAAADCAEQDIPLVPVGAGREVACLHPLTDG